MRRIVLFAVLAASSATALADPPAGAIDPTFGSFNQGILGLQKEGFNLGADWHDQAFAMEEDAQGRLLLAGIAQVDEGYCLGLMRFTPDGQLDTTDFGFNQNAVAKGKVCHPVLEPGVSLGHAFDLAMLPDGGIFVGGIVDYSSPFVCRFHADGRKMDNFGGGTGCVVLSQIDIFGSERAPVLLPQDDSVLVVANHRPDWPAMPVLTRISASSGAVQPFGQQAFVPLLSGNAAAYAWDAVLTEDGDLVAVGHVEDGGDIDGFVARFDLQQLQPDFDFSGDGMASFKFNKTPGGQDYLKAVVRLPDGDILAAGNIRMPGREGIAIVRLDPASGANSPEFNNGSPKAYDPCSALPAGCEQVWVNDIASTDGHIVVAGAASIADGPGGEMFVARLTAAGNADPAFGQGGFRRIDLGIYFTQISAGATSLVMQDERIVLAGSAYSGGDTDFAVLRLSGGRLFEDQFESAGP